MKIGGLHEALTDWHAPREYGHIPDAMDEELALIKALGIRAPADRAATG
jgi:hypothetical protein